MTDPVDSKKPDAEIPVFDVMVEECDGAEGPFWWKNSGDSLPLLALRRRVRDLIGGVRSASGGTVGVLSVDSAICDSGEICFNLGSKPAQSTAETERGRVVIRPQPFYGSCEAEYHDLVMYHFMSYPIRDAKGDTSYSIWVLGVGNEADGMAEWPWIQDLRDGIRNYAEYLSTSAAGILNRLDCD